jgi:hypothetical protein
MNDAPRTVPYYINEAKSDMQGINQVGLVRNRRRRQPRLRPI